MASFYEITIGDQIEFQRRLSDAGLSTEDVDRIKKDPTLASAMVKALREEQPKVDFVQFNCLLNGLADQKKVLARVDAQLPRKLRLGAKLINGLETASDHVQTLEDLETFVVIKPTLEETWCYKQAFIGAVQPMTWETGFDKSQMELHSTAYQDYEPGIYLVRVNLVANWVPGKARSVREVRQSATGTLASTEAMDAYMLQQPALLQAQDGDKLPYVDCAGIESGDRPVKAPVFRWNDFYRGVYFGSWDVGHVGRNSATPALRGVPQKVA